MFGDAFDQWVWFDYSDYENYKPDMNLSIYSIYNTPEVCKRIDDKFIHDAIKTLREYRTFETRTVTFDNKTYNNKDAIMYLGFTSPYVIKKGPNGKTICGLEYSFVQNSTKIRNICMNSTPYKVVYSIRHRLLQIINSYNYFKKRISIIKLFQGDKDTINKLTDNSKRLLRSVGIVTAERGSTEPEPFSVIMYTPIEVKRVKNPYPTDKSKTILAFHADTFMSAVLYAWIDTIYSLSTVTMKRKIK